MPDPIIRNEYPPGIPCWIDLEPADVAAAIEFYRGVFGWTFEDRLPPDAPGRYAIATRDGLTVAAVGSADGGGHAPARWNTYISVDDIDAAAAAAAAAGGVVVVPPQAAGPPGRSAVVADPTGAELRLWQPGTNPGAQAVNVDGTWNWSNLHTADAAAVTGFYSAVFGWELEAVGAGGVEYALMFRRPGYGEFLATLEPDIYGRQDGSGAPPGFADAVAWLVEEPPGDGWAVVFSVDDTDRTASRVEECGGKVVIAPYDQGPTRIAVVADDQGTEFWVNTFYPERLVGPS